MLAAYATLAKSHPNSGSVQEAYAELLGDSADNASREAALAMWRKIATRSPPRSQRWLKAKYSVASLQLKLGDPASAAALFRFLLESSAGVKATVWQERFEKLLEEASK